MRSKHPQTSLVPNKDSHHQEKPLNNWTDISLTSYGSPPIQILLSDDQSDESISNRPPFPLPGKISTSSNSISPTPVTVIKLHTTLPRPPAYTKQHQLEISGDYYINEGMGPTNTK
jgi:hypothetical protein